MGACLSSKADAYAPDVPGVKDQQTQPSSDAHSDSIEIRPEVEQALRAAYCSNSSYSRADQGTIALGSSVRTSNSLSISPFLLASRSIRGTPAGKAGIGADLGLIMDDQGMLNPMVRPRSPCKCYKASL